MVKTKHLQVYHNICMPSLAFSECIYTLQIICSAQKLQNKHVYITWTYACDLKFHLLFTELLHAQQDYNSQCDSSAFKVFTA